VKFIYKIFMQKEKKYVADVCFVGQMMYRTADDVKFAVLKEMLLTYKLLSLAWVSSRTVVFIDVSERAHVIDVQTTSELEVVDLADIGLAYSTGLWKLLQSSSAVGRALSQAGERLCYESVASFGGQLVALGATGVHVFSIRTWIERLSVLVRRRQFADALTLARSFYERTASSSGDAASDSRVKRREVVAERILELIAKYVDHVDTLSSVQNGESNISDLYRVCIPYSESSHLS